MKDSYAHPSLAATSVILDGVPAVHTPAPLFLATGLRALDHAVEDLASINLDPLAEAAAIAALGRLPAALRAVRQDPSSAPGRLEGLVGAWLAMIGGQSGVDKGASHGIGHVLGAVAGVPHGLTSCVMLPTVLRFNAPVSGDRQARVAAALASPGVPAADAVAALVAELGLPGRLRDVGVDRSRLPEIAEKSMDDRWVRTNPRRIEGPSTVMALLEAAW